MGWQKKSCQNAMAAVQADIQHALVGVTNTSEQGQVLTLTVDDIPHILTIEEIGQVSLEDCQEMYTVSTEHLTSLSCLLSIAAGTYLSAVSEHARPPLYRLPLLPD